MPFPLKPRRVEKPWGRRHLPDPFFDPGDRDPVGEIIFEPEGRDCSLLVKFLFTSEKLSIQVHPDDLMARNQGLPRGKDEAWLVLGAEPGSVIGLGLKTPLSGEALRASATDGSLESAVDWRTVHAGEAYYSPAGTIHAIGPGLFLLEIQQNLDVTYRLYDYGRPRDLHLDDAVAAARTDLRIDPSPPLDIAPGREHLAGGPAFQVEHLTGPSSGHLTPPGGELWLIVLAGEADLDGNAAKAGQVWLVDRPCLLRTADGADLVIAYPGASTASIWQAD